MLIFNFVWLSLTLSCLQATSITGSGNHSSLTPDIDTKSSTTEKWDHTLSTNDESSDTTEKRANTLIPDDGEVGFNDTLDAWNQLLASQQGDTFNLTDFSKNDAFINITEASQVAEELQKRVINGENAPKHTFRWAVSIKGVYPTSRATTYCGASLISNQWLVTAAHCFIGKTKKGDTMRNPKYWHVQAGNVYIDLGAGHSSNQRLVGPSGLNKFPNPTAKGTMNLLNILNALLKGKSLSNFMPNMHSANHGMIIHAHPDKIVVHPKYKSTELEWDIALIHLKFPIDVKQYPDLDIINMPTKEESKAMPRAGEVCVLIGWGCRHKGGGPSTRAQMARLKVIENHQCSRMYNHNAGLNREHEFCAGYYKGNLGICPGDSGSGLACNRDGKWFVAGVASATHALKPASYPGLFTRVSYFRDWIDEVTNHGLH